MDERTKNEVVIEQQLADLRGEADSLRFSQLSHAEALALGEQLFNRCRHEGHRVIVGVDLGQRIVYRAALPGTKGDAHTWIDRKFAAVRHFGRSTMELELEALLDPCFADKRGLDLSIYGLFGGGVPLHVGDLMVGVVGVSGLASTEDHRLIVETIRAFKASQRV